MTDDAAYVHQIFPACIEASKTWEETELCVKTGAVNAGYPWSFSYGPDGTKVATIAYWTFQNLKGQAIFEAAQKLMKDRP